MPKGGVPMLTRTSLIALAATAMIAGSGLTPTAASAGWWQHQFDMHRDRRDIRTDNADIYRDRVDLRKDYIDLRHDLKSGNLGEAVHDLGDIRRDRVDVYKDEKDVRRDRRDLFW